MLTGRAGEPQLGDYYAAARIAGAPVPPPDVIGRAVAWQGICCMLTGLWGTGNGTTAYNENIGAMQVCSQRFTKKNENENKKGGVKKGKKKKIKEEEKKRLFWGND